MPDTPYVRVISPYEVNPPGDIGPFPFDLYQRACLAQGDSWFSIGALPPTDTTNVLAELQVRKSTVVVNCARPGKVLTHMADSTTEVMFLRQLTGNSARKWDAILISGVGNDVIDAARLPPTHAPEHRLLKTVAERSGDPLVGENYICEPGWTTLRDHIELVFNQLVGRRDSGVNRGQPMLFHNYARLQPRPAPAGPGFGPWLQPAFDAFSIPANAWLAVSDALMNRTDRLLRELVREHMQVDSAAALYVVDTRTAALLLALPASAGRSGDYQNEIHPTVGGYAKVASVWRASLEALPTW